MILFSKSACLFFVLILNQITVHRSSPQKILLSIYYESNCPDSRKFVLHQLQPAMRMLHHYVKLHLIPFGKSRSINYGDDGFECQHGQAECLGNMVQDCALYHMKHSSDRERLQYVACELATNAGSQGDLQCVRQVNLPEDKIEECVLMGKGTILQLESEYFTSLVNPSFVPTITINGIFDQELQDNALEDLFGTICSVAPNIPPCASHYNNMALGYIMQKTARPNWL